MQIDTLLASLFERCTGLISFIGIQNHLGWGPKCGRPRVEFCWNVGKTVKRGREGGKSLSRFHVVMGFLWFFCWWVFVCVHFCLQFMLLMMFVFLWFDWRLASWYLFQWCEVSSLESSKFPMGWIGSQKGTFNNHMSLFCRPSRARFRTGQKRSIKTRWWFQIFFIFTPTWGRFPFWLIFFRWVETVTTNQKKLVKLREIDTIDSSNANLEAHWWPKKKCWQTAWDVKNTGS